MARWLTLVLIAWLIGSACAGCDPTPASGSDGGGEVDASAGADAGADDAGCVPETDQELCQALGYECGDTIAMDRCGQPRPEVDCGGCAPPALCGGSGQLHVCGTGACEAESTPDGTWVTLDSPTDQDLHGIWGAAEDDIWAVGAGGTLLRFQGQDWAVEGSVVVEDLLALHGSAADNVWAVGDAVGGLRFDGQSWALVDAGVIAPPLFAVRAVSATEVWAGGYSVGDELGTLFTYDGSAWSFVPTYSDLVLSLAVWPPRVWIGTLEGAVLQWDGQALASLGSVGGGVLRAAGAQELWSMGNRLSRWDGQDWTTLADGSLPYQRLEDAQLVATDDIWAVGHAIYLLTVEPRRCGLIRHWDGVDWHLVDSSLPQALRGVWVSPQGVVWAVGDGGLIVQRQP